MNYYEILPLKKTGTESRTFTYHSDAKMEIGSLARIPLKNRFVRGIILEDTTKPTYATKPVDKVLSSETILSEGQIKIAKKISEYYLCSLGETINAYLPFDFGKKRRPQVVKNVKRKAKNVSKITPNSEQTEIISQIMSSKPKTIHLLHGVTGSGKTEIYLRLAEEALSQGAGTIILVPEIALTPQTYDRFYERFGDSVAVWHSDLKETEKYDTWKRAKDGEKLILLGARSAIFMPINNLRYIIIDEEHESSYKQDQNPRYDARLVAEWLAQEEDAKLVLGSATPRIETYYKAQNAEYLYYSLDKRIVQNAMPPVSVVDLRDEFRKGNKSIISDNLFEAITNTLGSKKQVMLLLNRRGAATFVTCRDCGYVESCPNCDIPLTYHISAQRSELGGSQSSDLKCHHCDFRKSTPTICPICASLAIKFFGLGTQRAELEIKKLFPKARVARMDRDTTKKRGSHEVIYQSFLDSEFDILIGTQMIAKGWDLPNVELVGIISADTMINLPDFRSAERTFSLLTQVAGRTGRGFHPGKVILQTYNPENYAVMAAKNHDYQSFYQLEISAREKYFYPPFSTLVRMVYSHPDANKAEKEAERVSLELKEHAEELGLTILGPSPSFIEKMAGKYRYQIVIKIPNSKKQETNKFEIRNSKLEILDVIKDNIKAGWSVDIDPESLL